MDFTNLAQKYGTPLYVYDFDYMAHRYEALKNAFHTRKSLVCYAVKANSNLSVLKFLAGLGAGFDCVSVGEVRRALLAGAKSYQIILSGVGKRDDELKFALENEILMIIRKRSRDEPPGGYRKAARQACSHQYPRKSRH